MKTLNEENKEQFLNFFKNLKSFPQDVKTAANRRCNTAINELKDLNKKDFWEGKTLKDFLTETSIAIKSSKEFTEEQKKFLIEVLRIYPAVVQEHNTENISSRQEDENSRNQVIINKENAKVPKKFNSETGEFSSVATECFNY